jgi:hypothetical protein
MVHGGGLLSAAWVHISIYDVYAEAPIFMLPRVSGCPMKGPVAFEFCKGLAEL